MDIARQFRGFFSRLWMTVLGSAPGTPTHSDVVAVYFRTVSGAAKPFYKTSDGAEHSFGTVTGGSSALNTLSVTSSAPGNFTVAHGLGAAPAVAIIQATSDGVIRFQSGTKYDSTNFYLSASATGVTADILFG